jgi:hypothetical protein
MVIVPRQSWGLVLLVNAYGLIALATALDQMTQGVTSLLMGQQPPPERISFNTPWSVMLLYQTDIISWLLAMMLLAAGTGITKTLLAILAWRKRQDQRRPVMQAIRLAEGVATRRNDESRKEATAVIRRDGEAMSCATHALP